MKNGINTGENRIPQKRIEKPLSHFRKYGNRTLQIRKRTDKSEKRNGSEREFLRPFSTLDTHTSVQRCRFILVIFFSVPQALNINCMLSLTESNSDQSGPPNITTKLPQKDKGPHQPYIYSIYTNIIII
jgi:hypothetical protein